MTAVLRWLGDAAGFDAAVDACLKAGAIASRDAGRASILGHERIELELDASIDVVRPLFHDLRAGHTAASLALLDAAHRRLAPGWIVFDADSTLVDAEGIDELAARAGVGDDVAAITAAAMRGELDYEASLRDRTRRLAGLAWSEVEAVAACMPLTPGAVETVEFAHARGWKVAVVSGGFLPLVGAVATRLGLDHVAAHALEVRDGALTGVIEGAIVDAEAKATIARELRGDGALVAVGDGANDLPMIEAADVGVSFCAKPVLEAAAGAAVRTKDLRAVAALVL